MLWNSSLTVICVFVPAFALIGVLEIFWIRRDWTLVRDIGLLADQVTAIRDGDLETPWTCRRTQTCIRPRSS